MQYIKWKIVANTSLAVCGLLLFAAPLPAPVQNYGRPAALYNESRQEFAAVFGRDIDGFGTNFAVSFNVYDSFGALVSGPNDIATGFTEMPVVSVAVAKGHDRALAVWQTSDPDSVGPLRGNVEAALLNLEDYSVIVKPVITNHDDTSATEVGVAFDPVANEYMVLWADISLLNTQMVDSLGQPIGSPVTYVSGSSPQHVQLVYIPPIPSNNSGSFAAIFFDNNLLMFKGAVGAVSSIVWSPQGSTGAVAPMIGTRAAGDYEIVSLFSDGTNLVAQYFQKNGDAVDTSVPLEGGSAQPPVFAADKKGGRPVFFNPYVSIGVEDFHFGTLSPIEGEAPTTVAALAPGGALTASHHSFSAAYAPDCDVYFVVATNGLTLDADSTGGPCPTSVVVEPSELTFSAQIGEAQLVNAMALGGSVTVANISIEGAGRNAYQLLLDGTCAGALAQNQPCPITVKHVGMSGGKSAALKISTTADQNGLVTVPLTDPLLTPPAPKVAKVTLVAPVKGAAGIEPTNALMVWQAPALPSPTRYRVKVCTTSDLKDCQESSSIIEGR